MSVDHVTGIVDMRPLELRSKEVRVVSVDQSAGRVPPKDASLRRGRGQREERRVRRRDNIPLTSSIPAISFPT